MGYSRESNYYYSPIGVELVQILGQRWSLGTVLEYDYFWGGVQQTNLKDVDSSLNNVRNDQRSGFGLRASFIVSPRARRGGFHHHAERDARLRKVLVGEVDKKS